MRNAGWNPGLCGNFSAFPDRHYHAPEVFGSFGRRALESVVGLFALLGFAFVPLGSKTGLEHTLAVLATPSVREAASGLVIALEKAKAKLVEAFVPGARDRQPLPLPDHPRSQGRVRPEIPALPANAHGAQGGLSRNP